MREINKDKNKKEFKELLLSINRDGIKDLVEYLETTDFYSTPASTKYHNSVEGGLCDHSLNVYHNLLKLIDTFGFADKFSNDSVKLVSLCHDIFKTDFYEFYLQNRKITETNGHYEWVQVGAYKVREIEQRIVVGDPGFNSVFILNKFIKLTEPEMVAIINCNLNVDSINNIPEYILEIYNRYPLAFLLHLADYASICIDENKYLYE